MKKIDKLIFTSMIPPYLLAFFVAEFVLVMQFLWKYIDEIIGKGISFFVLMELIFYFAVTIIPLAIPLTILISSVMVFGNLGEKYELSSMKSAGVSLIRIMAAAIVVSVLTAGFSFVASNYLKPKANYKFYYRFNSVRKQKPSLSISPKVFNDDFKNMVMRVGEKYSDGKTVEDILIYDHSKADKSEVHLITAKDGEMYSTDDGKHFIIKLFDGIQYGDVKKSSSSKDSKGKNQFVRTEFAEWNKVFDMSQFDLEATNLNLSRKTYDLMNTFQLKSAIDTFTIRMDSITEASRNIYPWYHDAYHSRLDGLHQVNGDLKQGPLDTTITLNSNADSSDTISLSKDFHGPEKLVTKNRRPTKSYKQYMQSKYAQQVKSITDSTSSIIQLYSPKDQAEIFTLSKNETRQVAEKSNVARSKVSTIRKDRNKHILRFHQQYSWALICIIFLFIGAPLGSIVKKGGYGYPLLFAILFFMMFIIINILGEKLLKGGSISPTLAAWLPCMILAPFSIYITYKALNDLTFSEFQKLKNWIVRKIPSLAKDAAKS